ncbi:hypothetical protein KCMC57_64540 (plasmid) [Kitasatospora sp. CMC57]|uniref:DUF721 domain-containing protein n=1 Tax=Kitasatospora sp. CMC57 TaxID=3231513 RepID=A0AB33K5L5_9ACTN
MSTSPSGRDLAREALAQALAHRKKTGGLDATVRQKPKQVRTARRSGGRDPVGLGAALAGLVAERGWQPGAAGGDLLERWPTIAPELAAHVRAEHFDSKLLCLHLRPSSPAFATQLNLFQQQLVQRINTAMGRPTVRSLRILRPTHQSAAPRATEVSAEPVPERGPAPAAPAELSAELTAARAAARAARAKARAEQDARRAALLAPYAHHCPAIREPEEKFVEAVRAREEAEEQARRAAALERRRPGTTTPPRASGAA